MEKFLSIKELSRILGVKVSTIYGWVHEGFIPHYKIGGLVRFTEAEIAKWLESKHRSGRSQRKPEV